MSQPVIYADHIKKTYGDKQNQFSALKNISLQINAGEIVAIIGKSGSGKSTLMHILALLDQPTSGVIEVNDTRASDLKGRKLDAIRNREFGFVFQSFFMNAHQTVLENVMLPLEIAGVKPRERRRRALAALEAVELKDKAKNKASDLSGGQKQRVCIARAIVNNPKVIFADEPTGNLDSATGDKIEQLLFGLNKAKGITLIIVTHDEEFANRCHRQIRIRDGIIESDAREGK